MSLIPDKPGISPNGWCTWATQNFTLQQRQKHEIPQFPGDQGAKAARNNIDEELVFGKNGWAAQWGDIRRDFFLILDDGWDVPYGTHPDKELAAFGSLEADEQRFPSCKGTPSERLKKLNELAYRAGWRGIGLWVAAQARGENWQNHLPLSKQREYWEARLKWSRDAGIEYWKVDWGAHGNDPAFRRMLTEMGKEIVPELWIEHSIGCQPLNDIAVTPSGDIAGSGQFRSMKGISDQVAELLQFSAFSRIYDTLTPMTTVTGFDRTALYLELGQHGQGILNIEDDVYMGAALGCAMAVMRSSLWTDHKYDQIARRTQRSSEVLRAIRWQRMAPAFELEIGKVAISRERLTDTWHFEKNSTWWAAIYGKTIFQSAPAVVARSVALPAVSGTDKPFIAASQNPNGALSIATLPRLSSAAGLHTPQVDVAWDCECTNRSVGVFGHFSSLRLRLTDGLKEKQVFAQDLASDRAYDITNAVSASDGWITIPGEVIEREGKRVGEPESAPGVLLLVKTT